MDALTTIVNQWGSRFIEHAGLMLVQAGILIIALLVLDRVLNKYIRATVRYYIWMLVLIKLILSPHLSLPMSVGSWIHWHPTNFSDQAVTPSNAEQNIPSTAQDKPLASLFTCRKKFKKFLICNLFPFPEHYLS